MRILWLAFAAFAAWFSVQPASAASLTLNATVRDFTVGAGGHPDFECCVADDHAIVANTLGADGKPVYAGTPTTVTTHGAAFFNQWYNDTPGVNLSTTITLVANETSPGSGIYSYFNGSYFPIDNMLFGNQGNGHNFHFTTEIHTLFTYQTGQTFSFSGDDDVWVFIDKKKAIDLGGVHGPESQSVNLDLLGLIVGHQYSLDIFNAERHTVGSQFSFQTSALLVSAGTVPIPGALPLFASGLGALALLARRRRRA